MSNAPIRILLVEDNPADSRMLCEILAETGIRRSGVECVTSLGDALARLDGQKRYDLILLDLTLPDSKGLETIRRCRAGMPGLPIIVLTGLDEALGIQAIRSGAQEYLVKGDVDARLLARTIGYARERKRLEVEREHLVDELARSRDELERQVQERTADLQRTVEVLRAEVMARKQAEDSLRQSEQRFRTVFEKAPIGVALVGLDGQLLGTNHALQEMLGYDETEMGKRTLTDLIYADDASRDRDLLEPLIRGEQDTYEAEKRFSHKDGQGLWVWLSVSLIRDNAGQACYAIALVADITERRRVEKKIADLMAVEHRRLGQELHDGLVQQIIGLGLMARNLYDKLKTESSAQADAAAELCELIRQAQNQSRAMLKGLRPVEVDANGLMAAIEELVSGTEKWYGIRCTFKCDQPVLVDDNSMATQLFYIAREAVTNAVRHAKAKHIEVHLGAKRSYVRLRVGDNGVGIRRDLRAYSKTTMVHYWFYQGEHGADLNHWRIK